jgi:hypothetical protein
MTDLPKVGTVGIANRTVLEGHCNGVRVRVIMLDEQWSNLDTGDLMPDGFRLDDWTVIRGQVTLEN